jgi:probable phosphoglycerate mutase
MSGTRILVLRHGESEWNAQRRWQGQQDPPLTHHGRRHAAATADLLGQFDGVWCSTLQRASETAVILAELLGVGPVIADPRLMERGFGAWEGLTAEDVEARWPGFLAAGARPDDAESTEALLDRVGAACADIARAHPGAEVLVISHAGLIRTLREHCGHQPLRIANLDGAWFHADEHGLATIRGGDAVTVGSHADLGYPVSDTL